MTARTAVVVVTYGSHGLLERHLAATTAHLPSALVVVVDNFTDQAERAAVQDLALQHGWQAVTLDDNRGYGAALNAGVLAAREHACDTVVVLNPDLDIDAPTVVALADAARADPMAVTSPRVTRPDGSHWFSGGTLDLRTGRTRTPRDVPDPVHWVSGACFALTTTLWDAVGGFDEDYFLYWEDVDLSARVRAAGGHAVVRTDLVAVHAVGGTQQGAGTAVKSSVYYQHNCRGRLLFAAKHLGRRDAARWALSSGRYGWEVVLRGGRRQLLASPAPLLAAARGTASGMLAIARAALRPRRSAPALPPGGRSDQAGHAGAAAPAGPRRLLVAHPSPDLYGSDRQLLETVGAAVSAGWSVDVVLPSAGPLAPLLGERGARVRVTAFPVLRKAVLRPMAFLGFAVGSLRALWQLTAALRRRPPDLLYVNTLTIPVWLVAARLAGVRTLCHVHEAEEDRSRLVSAALTAPLRLADRVMVNSAAARRALGRGASHVGRQAVVVHNGVPGPDTEPGPRAHHGGRPWELALVARLSPRKGVDVALEAVALLAAGGRDVHLTVCGTVFEGYEWYEDELRTRAAEPDLAGRVDLRGYVHPTWPVLAGADVVLVPSRFEPFGNTAVEGLLARRPVVASDVQGLAEILTDGRTGLLVHPGDPAALAAAVGRLIDEPALRHRLADDGRQEAVDRFGTERYGTAVVAEMEAAVGRPHRPV